MKKILLTITVILAVCLCLGAGAWCLCDEGTRAVAAEWLRNTWGWIEANVLSEILSVGAIIGVASVELIPVIRGFTQSKSAFSSVASQVSAYTEARLEYDMRAEEREKAFYAKMEALRIENDERVQARDRELLEREAALARSIEEFTALARGFEDKLGASEARLECILHHIDVNADKTERMVGLAFTNSGELVSKGVAKRIAEVEHEE